MKEWIKPEVTKLDVGLTQKNIKPNGMFNNGGGPSHPGVQVGPNCVAPSELLS